MVRSLQVQGGTVGNRTAAGHLANVIDGVGEATLARLEELQVTTFVELAYSDPVRLMARSGLQLRALLTWIDQALLASYAPALKIRLAEVGFPCALDVSEFYERHAKSPETSDPRHDAASDPSVGKLAEALSLQPVLLVELLRSVYTDPHVRFLNAAWYGDA
jgi:hypothetical protein